MAIKDLSVESLRKAIGIREQIEQLETELNSMLGGPDTTPALGGPDTSQASGQKRRGRPPGKTGGRSAEWRARIAEAQRARWAKQRGESASQPAAPAQRGPKKGGMSPEARERIAAAQRARWAKYNKGKR